MPDGDFVDLDWAGDEGPVVIVLPGLQGDLKSSHVRGLLRQCVRHGWRGVLLNYRGRGEPNRLSHSYHCGMTCDLDYLVRLLHQREPNTTISTVGFSVGANICLKWLGECGRCGQEPPIASAVGVSAPFNLGGVVKRIQKGLSRIYQWHLLKSLRGDLRRKMELVDVGLGLTRNELSELNTFHKFDDRVTAPMNGFDGAEDYYAKPRSDTLLKCVSVPTLIINARNDPLVPAHLIPLSLCLLRWVLSRLVVVGKAHSSPTLGTWQISVILYWRVSSIVSMWRFRRLRMMPRSIRSWRT